MTLLNLPKVLPSEEIEVEHKMTEDELMQEGYDLCFGDTSTLNVEKGRSLFSRAAKRGRHDANYFLGCSFKKEGLFEEAALHFENGLKHRHIRSIYCLALLHKGNRLLRPDREFYLTTIDKLAGEDYAPALLQRAKERLKGSFGLRGFIIGLVYFFPDFFHVVAVAKRDENDPRLGI